MSQTPVAERTPEAEPTRPKRGWGVRAVLLVAVLLFLAGGAGGSYQSKLTNVQKNDNAAYLPKSAESTKVSNEAAKFVPVENIPGFIVFNRPAGLTADDKSAIGKAYTAIQGLTGVIAASIYAPLIAKQDGKIVQGGDLSNNEKRIVDTANGQLPSGLQSLPAGPGGLLTAFLDAFSGLDSALIFAAGGVVVLILLVVYRSPVLWVFPLLSVGLALGLSSMIIYGLASHNILTLNGQSQGILQVLVFGVGTDYALLLISRYREELHTYPSRFDAMIKAWRESAPAIGASAATVTIGLLCLGFSELNSNKSLGPVAAIGVVCTVLIMMTFLPVALAATGRWVFWPRKPHVDHAADLATHGMWGRIASTVVTRHRPAWVGTAVLLALCVIGIASLQTNGLTTAQSFTNTPKAVTGQKLYDAKFDKGAGAPAMITVNADHVQQVIDATQQVRGISQRPGAVCMQIDYAKAAALRAGGGAAAGSAAGCAPSSIDVAPIGGRLLVNATLADSYDSSAAYDTIARLRTALHAIPGADARVGGASAATLDVQKASIHDRNLIIPIVLVVIFVILSLLLRALIAPLLLIATVVLSFAATLGVCGFAFRHVFNFAGADQSFPLFAFVFLVALGIDYNIFLMTRVREETLRFGTRQGVRRGLAVTGGVITSAGVVLAATFTVLGILPLVFLAEIGFAVAFGVLLDTILVRSILVPALATDIGKRIWWPSRLAAAAD